MRYRALSRTRQRPAGEAPHSTVGSWGTRAILLKLSCRALLRRQDLETCRPPPRFNRFDELVGQLLLSHLPRERAVVVFDRDELDGDIAVLDRQKRIADVRPAIIRRTSDDTRVDDVPSIAQALVPMKPAVRADDDIGVIFVAHALQKRIGRSRSPETFVDLSRRAV